MRCHPLRHHAADDVGGATRRQRHDQRDRPMGIGLGQRDRGTQRRNRGADHRRESKSTKTSHCSLPISTMQHIRYCCHRSQPDHSSDLHGTSPTRAPRDTVRWHRRRRRRAVEDRSRSRQRCLGLPRDGRRPKDHDEWLETSCRPMLARTGRRARTMSSSTGGSDALRGVGFHRARQSSLAPILRLIPALGSPIGSPASTPRSSRGLGHQPLTLVTGVRIPYGAPSS